jgi:hypothetical protein
MHIAKRGRLCTPPVNAGSPFHLFDADIAQFAPRIVAAPERALNLI